MPIPSIVTSAKAAAKAYRLRVSIESIVQGIEASRLRPGGSLRRGRVERGLRHRRAHFQERVLRHRSRPALRHGVALRADRARRRPDCARRDAHPHPGQGRPAVRRALAHRQALQAHHRQPGDLPGREPLRGDRARPGHPHREVLGRGHRRGARTSTPSPMRTCASRGGSTAWPGAAGSRRTPSGARSPC